MDPISRAITAALAAGATAGPAADAYQALQAAIQRKHGPHSDLAQAVDKLQQRPNSAGWKEELATQVRVTHAAQDPQLLSLAQDLIAALKETPAGQQALGKYDIQVQGGQVGIIGDRAHVQGGMHFGGSGDTFNMSGDLSGANVNVKSTLTHVTQTIGKLPNADPTAKAELERLIRELNDALQKAPSDKKEDAEAVAELAQQLVEKANKEKPNRTMVQVTGEGLKQAAQNLADVAPTVLTIATQIIETIGQIVR
jgi:ElaB/YqjD/DUF883 family membrane-anchored ribosome-binding protein